MAQMKNDLMAVAGLVLGLFLLAIIVGVTYVGAGEFKKTLCTQALSTNVYESETCLNATGDTEVTVESITNVNLILAALAIVIGLVGLVVIILIFKIVIKVAKSFGSGF